MVRRLFRSIGSLSLTLSAVALLAVFACTAGCAVQREAIKSTTVSSAAGVFRKVAEGSPPLSGSALLYVSSSLKTHRQKTYTLDSCRHGKPDFKMVLNIDGQAITLHSDMKDERSAFVGATDPEAGDGLRYVFRDILQLRPGSHNLKVAIPDDGVVVAREVTLKEGVNQLVLKPHYRKRDRKEKIGFVGDTSFYRGISTLRLFLNGEEL